MTHPLTIERAVLAEFLGQPRWSRSELQIQLEHVDPRAIDSALAGLVVAGVVIPDGLQFQVAPCVTHLHALGLLSLPVPNGNGPAKVNVRAIDRVLARRALEAYAQRRMVDRDKTIIGELAPLVDRARRAGLDTNAIARCISQPTLEGA